MQKKLELEFPKIKGDNHNNDYKNDSIVILTDGSRMTYQKYKCFKLDIALFREPLPIKYTIDEEETQL